MDPPWIISSKKHDAWGAAPGAADASRKRAVGMRPLYGAPPPGFPVAKGAAAQPRLAKMEDLDADTSSFLDAAAPLILMMQIGISMPVQRRKDGTYVSRVRSAVMLYTLVVYALLSVFVFFAASAAARRLADRNNTFHDQIYNMTPLLLLNVHPLLPLLHWPEARSVATYFNSWLKFEAVFQRVCRRPLHLQMRSWVARQTATSLLLALLLAGTTPLYMGLTWMLSLAYVHLCLASICLVSIWLMSARALRLAAEALRESMHEVVVSNTCTADLMADYRQAWLELSELTQETGRAWTYSCGHLLLYLFLLMTVTAFGVLAGVARASFEPRTLAYGAIAAGSGFTLFIICSGAENAADRVAQALREDLLMVQLADDTQHFKNEVQMFMTALAMDPPIVNLSGYCTVNRALFASLLETMVTYLVVLVQFAYSLDATDTNATTTAAPTTMAAPVPAPVLTTLVP